MDPDFRPAKRPARSSRAVAPGAKIQTSKDTPKPTEIFRTPEEVAAERVFEPSSDIPGQSAPRPDRPSRAAHGWRHKLALRWPPGRKEYITALVVVALVVSGVFLAVTRHGAQPVATAQPVKATPKAPKSTTVPSTLSGLPVDPSVNQRPVTGVMIENSVDARPQSGLSQASVVFEAIAEGGITRFLALYQDTAPDNVGPIRSARPYFEQWVLGFNAGYAHVGGSPEALADIKAWGVRDLDQFYNGGSYHRISSRAAPHNVYTGIGTLNQLEAGKGYATSTFTGFTRKKETPSKQPTAKSISLSISGPLYNVHYDYTAATNSYARSEAGAPHIDANTNTQISPKVVIALVMPYSLEADGYHSDYSTIGSGPVYVFQDGTVTTGQWAKSSATSQFVFTDASGQTIKLNPGQTWLTAVGSSGDVTYAP